MNMANASHLRLSSLFSTPIETNSHMSARTHVTGSFDRLRGQQSMVRTATALSSVKQPSVLLEQPPTPMGEVWDEWQLFSVLAVFFED